MLWQWPELCQCFLGLKTGSSHLFQIQTVRILTQLLSRASLTPWTLTLCCGRHSAACEGSGRQGGAPAPTFILKYKRQKKYGERDEIFNKMKKEKNLFYNQYLRRMGHWPSIGAVQASGSLGLPQTYNKYGCSNSSTALFSPLRELFPGVRLACAPLKTPGTLPVVRPREMLHRSWTGHRSGMSGESGAGLKSPSVWLSLWQPAVGPSTG